MTLKEAIEHCKEKALTCDNKECALDHFQLFKWLNEYQSILEKQSEQNLANSVKTCKDERKHAWSEEDEKTINNICHIIRQYDKISKKENQPCWYIGDCLLWMQNIKNKVIPQTKQEWSEEDYIEIKRITGLLEGWASTFEKTFYEKECKRGVAWLKSLNDRVQPQPRQEWSEEDEKIYQSIMDDIVQENQLDEKQIDWIINIKYRNFAQSQKQWKPSDLQIEALESATENCAYSEYQDCLRELIGQLKKLRDGKL